MKQRIHILALILLLGMVTAVDAQTKMGYTNVELLMAYMPEVKSVNSALKTYEADLSKMLEKKQTTL